ncbi:hypothetical protein GH714_030747 [Hevea brasiliensis]|uniref:Pentatricopeptide repeat-containing protein n=1 Tax=Hevea brasiliensis TaxID=3981 RepID=A0A6A6LCG3_HEVBR|nr:hypothetical protein GH714_030747 [Hevea brasiliensis]
MTIKTTVAWNSILAGYSKKRGRSNEVRELFDKIPEPDTIFIMPLACCIDNSEFLKWLELSLMGYPKKSASWNTMISGFAHNGQMDKARDLFLIIPNKNVVKWNAMISGYVAYDDLHSAVKLFQIAPVKGYVENSRAVEGVKLFITIVVFGIRPNLSTLSSLLLGCSKLSALQIRKTSSSASMIRKNNYLAEFAAKNLLGLDPTSANGYVQLAKFMHLITDGTMLPGYVPDLEYAFHDLGGAERATFALAQRESGKY